MENTAPVAEAPVESPVESQVESSEVETPAVPEKFRVWEHDKSDSEPPKEQSIPYSRFREVNEERKAYEAQLRAYEERLAKYDAREAELAAIKSPEDIKPDDYDTPEEYIRAMQRATKEQAVREVEERFNQRQRDAVIAQQHQVFAQNYLKNMSAAVERNPEIAQASAWLDKYAEHLPAEIAHELMIDENVGELIYDITTNQELLTRMFKGNPKDFIRDLHKMSARIDREARYAASGAGDNLPEAALKVSRRSEISSAIPSQVKASTRGQKSIYQMSTAEYRAWKASQK